MTVGKSAADSLPNVMARAVTAVYDRRFVVAALSVTVRRGANEITHEQRDDSFCDVIRDQKSSALTFCKSSAPN